MFSGRKPRRTSGPLRSDRTDRTVAFGARLVNELELDLGAAHFGDGRMDREDGRAVSTAHPLSFERADRELCFDRFKKPIPEENLHFPNESVEAFASTWKGVRCKVAGRAGRRQTLGVQRPLKREGAT